MANWSELPIDIVYVLANQLPRQIEEYVTFGSVCKSWNSCLISLRNKKPIACSPWLMLAKKENDYKISEDDEQGIRSFYSISSKRVHDFQLPTQGRRCWGTPYGWVFTLGLDRKINLLNPLSGAQIPLPPQSTFPCQFPYDVEAEEICRDYLHRVAVEANPSDSNQRPIVVVICTGLYVAIARPGAEAWVLLDEDENQAEDVIFFKGQFYIVDYFGKLKVCEITPTKSSVTQIASAPDGVESINRLYLVEMAGDLYFVARIFHDDELDWDEFYLETTQFVVFKYNSITRDWTTVKDLGDHAFFVGNNTSFCISTSQHPHFNSNCIYFTDDHFTAYGSGFSDDDHFTAYGSGFSDMGVYDISRSKVEPIYLSEDKVSSFSQHLFFMPAM